MSVRSGYLHGQKPKGYDRLYSLDYQRLFQLIYAYEARKPDIEEQIAEMAFNEADVRDIAGTLKIGINTVMRMLNNSRQSE